VRLLAEQYYHLYSQVIYQLKSAALAHYQPFLYLLPGLAVPRIRSCRCPAHVLPRTFFTCSALRDTHDSAPTSHVAFAISLHICTLSMRIYSCRTILFGLYYAKYICDAHNTLWKMNYSRRGLLTRIEHAYVINYLNKRILKAR
jgi:hypothetical protein